MYEPEHTAAYRSESLENVVVSQHRMMHGTGPSRKSPGGGMRGEPAELMIRLLSSPKLLVLAEWWECPDELCLPSDLCDRDRSVSGWLPSPLPVRSGNSLLERLVCP